ncbi:MAG TPA: SDR family oxidoreductase, partial [Pirellulaceae bacterium]|nr:SDR family oxidoreductase [Pirellulaceae bacterium]
SLRRFQYVSTCYVSGRHDGLFRETDLDVGQSFNNYYEETKFLAEQLVRERMQQGLAATIYRPAIVMGDRRTGATQKYDGPYCVIRLLLRQPRLAVLPVVGDTRRTVVNIVPRDFVTDAIAYLGSLDVSCGQTYHLADPSPLTVDQLLRIVGRATRRRALRVRLPGWLARFALDHVPGVYRLLQIPSAALAYFEHPTRYDCTYAQRDLSGGPVSTPSFAEYVDALVEFVRRNPQIGTAALL